VMSGMDEHGRHCASSTASLGGNWGCGLVRNAELAQRDVDLAATIPPLTAVPADNRSASGG
jgi:hypothetical protein